MLATGWQSNMKRNIKNITTLIIFSILFISNTQSVFSVEESNDLGGNRVIVKFHSIIPNYFRERAVRKLGLKLDEKLKLKNTFSIEVPENNQTEIIGKLADNFIIDYVEKDYRAEALYIPDDPLYDQQWGMQRIEMDGAWEVTQGSSEVDIAIIDTGINTDHPDLLGKVSVSVNCTLSGCQETNYTGSNGHATHVAGIASAITNNSIGVSGVAGGADIMSVKVLDESGAGYYSWIANGIVWATDNGAEVINLSLGGRFSSITLMNAIKYAWDKGVVIVAAAGNDGRYLFTYPAYYPEVIAVGAVNENDERAYFSNYGSWVDITAPGVDILSTENGDYVYRSGTSMATPFVTGVAALVISQNPNWDNNNVREQIEITADEISGTGFYFQNGRVNACNALDCHSLIFPTSTPIPTITSTVVPSPTETPIPTPTVIPSFSPTPTDAPVITPTPTEEVTPTPTFEPTQTPTLTPTEIPTPTVTLVPSPTPTSKELPWWCSYVPWHYTCQ